jgi:hypothetical protein
VAAQVNATWAAIRSSATEHVRDELHRFAVAGLGRGLRGAHHLDLGCAFCIKPSQFTDNPRDVGRLCRDIIRYVDAMLP